MIYTTLNKLKKEFPCEDGWNTLVLSLGKAHFIRKDGIFGGSDDEPVSLAHIVESNGIDDALWATRAVPEQSKKWRLYAVWCARQVQYLTSDARSIAVVGVSERFANGEATREELATALSDAWNAASEAPSDVGTTEREAMAAARYAAGGIPRHAAMAAATATTSYAGDFATAAVRDAQKTEFLRILMEN